MEVITLHNHRKSQMGKMSIDEVLFIEGKKSNPSNGQLKHSNIPPTASRITSIKVISALESRVFHIIRWEKEDVSRSNTSLYPFKMLQSLFPKSKLLYAKFEKSSIYIRIPFVQSLEFHTKCTLTASHSMLKKSKFISWNGENLWIFHFNQCMQTSQFVFL